VADIMAGKLAETHTNGSAAGMANGLSADAKLA
jgi:hypothetical protein